LNQPVTLGPECYPGLNHARQAGMVQFRAFSGNTLRHEGPGGSRLNCLILKRFWPLPVQAFRSRSVTRV